MLISIRLFPYRFSLAGVKEYGPELVSMSHINVDASLRHCVILFTDAPRVAGVFFYLVSRVIAVSLEISYF